MLGADVLVLQPLGFLLGGICDATQTRGQRDLRATVRARLLIELRPHRRRQRRWILVQLPNQAGHDPLTLFEQREQQMFRQNFGMTFAVGELLRAEDRFLCLLRVFVDIHFFMLAGPTPARSPSAARLRRASLRRLGRAAGA